MMDDIVKKYLEDIKQSLTNCEESLKFLVSMKSVCGTCKYFKPDKITGLKGFCIRTENGVKVCVSKQYSILACKAYKPKR